MTFFLNKIKISINFPAFCIMTLIILLSKSDTLFWGLLAAICHELGHIIIMMINNNIPSSISINLFDIRITEKSTCQYYVKDILTLLAGPLVNLIIFIFLLIININLKGEFMICFMNENLILCLFNLIPIYFLDGGKILHILINRHKNCMVADKILKTISFSILIILSIIGFYILMASKFNFSLLFISIYLILVLLFSWHDI